MRSSLHNLWVLAVLGSVSLFAQTADPSRFTINPSQVDLVLAAGFDHVPKRVLVLSNAPNFDIGSLRVSSDAAWVTPSVETGANRILLTFSTASLISQPATATITAWQGTTTNRFFVYGNMVPLNVVKLVADPTRSRAYGIHMNGVKGGGLVSLDPLTGVPVASATLGNRPTDAAIAPDGAELFVIHSVDRNIVVVDPSTLSVKETIRLPEYDDWGAESTSGDIALGPAGILYYSDGGWAPTLRVLDRATGQVLQRLAIDSHGFGDFALSPDKKNLIAWAQYGWSAGWAGSYLARFAVDPQGQLTFAEATSSQYPTVLSRDPLDCPVLFSQRNGLCFVKQVVVSSGAVGSTLSSFPEPVFAISPGGELAATSSALFETKTGNRLCDLPVQTSVQAVSTDSTRLVYFDPSRHELHTLDLLAAIGPGVIQRELRPADGAVALAPDRLEWSPVPGALGYQVYLGLGETNIAAAGVHSAAYLGAVQLPEISVTNPWVAGATYYWRVDVVTANEVTQGAVYRFTVSEISSSVNALDLSTLQGCGNVPATLQLESATPGQAWQASAEVPWISFSPTAGTTPATLTVRIDASKLPVGNTNTSVSIHSGTHTLFTIPLALRVEPLMLTVLESDPASACVYGISEDSGGSAPRAYLLRINTETESIERAVPAGFSATDLAVHNGDGRIYVPNWTRGQLLAFNKATLELERSFAVPPFGGVGYSQNDVYKVAAGAPGRLMVEGADQWINVSLFSTFGGTNLVSVFQREGGGAFSPDGRYYYHGDNNSSGAEVHKFDVLADAFTELAHIRVSSGGYYGSRTVVVSEDAQRVFWNGSAFDANLVEQWTMSDLVYCCSRDGRYAFGKEKIYDVVLRRAVLGMPVSTSVSAFNTTSRKLVLAIGGGLRCFPLGDPPSLPKPVLRLSSVTDTTAALSWTDESLETGFTLQRRLLGTSAWENLASLPQNASQTVVGGLLPRSSYEFRLKADAPECSSDWSDALTVATPGPVPNAPRLDTAVASGAGVQLTWTDVVGEDRYVLQRRSGTTNIFSLLATLPADTTHYTDGTVVSDASYEYRLQAANEFGASAYSSSRTVTVPPPAPPAAPALSSVRAWTGGGIEIVWVGVDGAQGYTLQRRTDNPASWIPIAGLAADASLYRDTNVSSGTEYWYRLAATNAVGASAFSASLSAIPMDSTLLVLDDFDPAPDGQVWAEIMGGVAVDGGKGFLGSKALWFGTNTVRYASTVPLPVTTGAFVEFKFRAGNQLVDGTAYWDNCEAGEQVVLEYSVNGYSWAVLETLNTTATTLTVWKSYSVSVPAEASSPRTRFRWRQAKHSGAGYDCWALDDVCVRVATPPALAAPPFILASAQSATRVALLWIASEGATYYVVERTQPGQGWTQVAVTPGDRTFFTDTLLLPSSSYAYRVKAGVWQIQSAYSSAVSVNTMSQVDDWLKENFGDTDTPLTAVGADGVPNILKYAFNLGSRDSLSALGVSADNAGTPQIWLDRQTQCLAVTLIRRKAASNPGVNYAVQFSSDLSHWQNAVEASGITELDAIWERATYRDQIHASEVAARYCRVIVTP